MTLHQSLQKLCNWNKSIQPDNAVYHTSALSGFLILTEV